MKQSQLLLMMLIVFGNAVSQPFVDIAGFSYQRFASDYKNNADNNTTETYSFSALLPKQFKNGNALLCRINAATIHSERTSEETTKFSNLSTFSVALGYQWVSNSRQWKTTLFAIPRIASDFQHQLNEKDWQYGGLLLEEYKVSPTLQLKAGVFVNREAFGHFFVPLLGVDWKATDRIYCYGVLPASYKLEYNAIRNKLYTGLIFKTQTYSFRIKPTPIEEYVRFDEVVLKVFADYYIFKNVVVNADVGYSLGKTPMQYYRDNDALSFSNPVYTRTRNYPVFNIGIAYRIRQDYK